MTVRAANRHENTPHLLTLTTIENCRTEKAIRWEEQPLRRENREG